MSGRESSAATAMPVALASAQWISPFEPVVAPAGQRPAYELTGSFERPGAGAGAAAGAAVADSGAVAADSGAQSGLGASDTDPVVIYATAHGIFELFVNGARVGNEELSPGFTSYRRRLQVQRWDITALLLPGKNTVTALLSDGWYRGRHGFVRRADGFGTQTAFLASVLIEPHADPGRYQNGGAVAAPLLVTDDSWTSRPSYVTRADLMDGQSVDFRLRDIDVAGAAVLAGLAGLASAAGLAGAPSLADTADLADAASRVDTVGLADAVGLAGAAGFADAADLAGLAGAPDLADTADSTDPAVRTIPTSTNAVLSTDPLCVDRSRLILAEAPPVRRIEELRPRLITSPREGVTVVDFGLNINGWVRLSALGTAGNRTVLRHGEVLDDEGEVFVENIRAFDFATHNVLPAGQIDEVISAGRVNDVFEPRHTTHGFRYVQLEGAAGQITADDILAVVVHSDLARTGTFSASDPLLNQLHDVVDWSFRGNACGVPTDCPQRERSGFTGDWQVFADTAALLYDVSAFSESWSKDLAADQWADGRVPTVVPNPAGNVPSGSAFEDMAAGSAGWGDAAVLVPWSMWRAYGDSAALERALPSMRAWVDYAARCAAGARHPERVAVRQQELPHERYLWDTGFHFGEWLEPDTPPAPAPSADHGIVATAFLFRSAQTLARAAAALGHPSVADEYSALAERVREAWCLEYLGDDNRLTEESQAHYVRALAFGLVPADRRRPVADRLAELIRGNGTRLGTGFLATGLLLPTLADNGHIDLAYDLLFARDIPSWLGMIDRGATTMWEWWDGVTESGVRGSLNHYSKGAVASFLYTHVAGIRLAENPSLGSEAYGVVTIAPQPGGGLTAATATIETRRGAIGVDWHIEGDSFLLEATLPAGVVAEIRLPDGSAVTRAEAGTHTFTVAVPAPEMSVR